VGKAKDADEAVEKWNEIRKEALRRSSQYRQEYEAAFQSYVDSLPPEVILYRTFSSKESETMEDRGFLPSEESDESERLKYLELCEHFQDSPQAQDLCQRWGIALALHPDNELWTVTREHAPAFFKDPRQAVKVVPHKKTNLIPLSEKWCSEKTSIVSIQGEKCLETEYQIDVTPHLRECRYLVLEIDLFHKKTQIMTEVEAKVDKYQVVINRRRVRGNSLDIHLYEEPPCGPITIFQVWDMNKKEGKTPWLIVKQLYTKEVNEKSYQPHANNFDYKAKSLKKLIEDAINRADKIIESITPTT